MTTAEALVAIRHRIDTPHRWTRGAYARDARGREVEPCDPKACRWCIAGALCAELGVVEEKDDDPAIEELCAAVPSPFLTLADLNDGSSHREVLAFLDAVAASHPDRASSSTPPPAGDTSASKQKEKHG